MIFTFIMSYFSLKISEKSRFRKWKLITIPEVCQNAKTKPAANYEKLVLLSRSIKGLQGEENVSYALEPLQADKNVAELAKQLAIINNFMATMDNSKDNKKKIESFITPLRQFLNKPDLSARVKAEGVETLEQLVNMLPENDVNPEVRDYLQTAKASVKNEVEKEIANSENAPPKRIENANSKSTKNNNSDSAGKRMVKKINGVEFAFRWCPSGTFTMGSPDHKKQHKVSLTKGFWILETEITQKHVKAIMGQYFGVPKFKYKSKEAEKAVIDILLAHQGESLDKLTPKEKKTIGDAQIILDNYPVTGMSWKRCQEFCKKCKTLGLPVQLPTEAQWEYACRAGSDEPYAKGLEEGQAGDIVLYGEAVDKELLDELKKTLNHYNIYLENLDVYNPDRIRCDELEKCGIYDFIYPVGKTIPNKWGIYDMHSNADEWTLDEYAEYKGIAEINPINNKGYSDYHVIRGGRSGNRRPYSELEHLNRIGFRVIMAQ